MGTVTKSDSRDKTMAEDGDRRSTGSSATEWMERIEENMRNDREENQILLRSMMDRLERMEEMNNERFGAGTSRRRDEIAEGKQIAETSGDEEPRRKDPYGVRSAVVEKSTPEGDMREDGMRR